MKKTSVSHLQYILHILSLQQLWLETLHTLQLHCGQWQQAWQHLKIKKKKKNISAYIIDKLLLSLCLVHWNAQNPVGTSKIWWWLVSFRQQGKFSLRTNYHLIFSLIRTIDGGIHFTANTEREMMKAHLNCVHVSTATKDAVLEGTQSGSSGSSCSENTRHRKLLVCVLTPDYRRLGTTILCTCRDFNPSIEILTNY